MRWPAGGSRSGAPVRTMINPSPDFRGSVNGPVYVAPASSAIDVARRGAVERGLQAAARGHRGDPPRRRGGRRLDRRARQLGRGGRRGAERGHPERGKRGRAARAGDAGS